MTRAISIAILAFLAGCSGQYAVTNTGTITTHQWVRLTVQQ